MTLAEWLAEGRRGLVEVETAAGAVRLHLDDGVLRLADDDPLAAPGVLSADLEPLLAILGAASSASLRFRPAAGPASTPGTPLPTARVVMEAAVRGRDRSQLWPLLGGRTVVLRMTGGTPLADQALAVLEPRLQALLSRFVKPRRGSELIGDDEAGFETLRDLARLRVVGLLTPSDADGERSRNALTGRSRELFLRRIARELERKPLRINSDEHRRQVIELVRNLGVFDYYDLLRAGRHVDEQAIHQAYVEVAKLAHPSHAEALGLDGRAAPLDLLFDAATEAYLVLSHPDRRRGYDRDLAPEVSGTAIEERRREKASVARDMYLRARRLALEQEYQPILELMQQAIQLDPQAEYYKLLGDVQRRNPQWKGGALSSYRDAVRCRPNDADLRLAFAQLLEELGDRKQAGIQYRAALELRPGDEKLQSALDLFENPPKVVRVRGGLLDGLLSLLRRGDKAARIEEPEATVADDGIVIVEEKENRPGGPRPAGGPPGRGRRR